jgi:MFS transporter, FSR family, fosmidomycin resistance protein
MVSRDTRVNALIGTGHFLSHFYQLCLPPLFLVWQRQFDVSFAELGLTVVLMSAMAAILQTPFGFLVDRYGARPFLIGGTLLMSLAIAAMAFATSFPQILLLALLSGIGNAVFHPADYAILAGSIRHERMGRSFALHTLTGNIGFAAAPPIVAALVAAFGWREALLIVGLAGLPVVGAVVWQSSFLKDQVKKDKAERRLSMRELLFERTMILFFLFYLLGSMAGSGIQAWLITVLHQVRGLDLTVASTALTAYMFGSGTGVLLGGWAADRLARHRTLFVIAFTALSATSTLLVGILPVGGTIAIGMMFLSGAALGASRTPRDIMLKDAAPPGEIGKVFGFVSAGLPAGGALTPVPFGILIDHGHAGLILILAAGLLLLSLACMGTAEASARQRSTAAPAAAE